MSDEDTVLEDSSTNVESETPAAGGRGRLRKIYTGPKKVYQEASSFATNSEFTGLAKVPITNALNGNNAEEWLDVMESELASVISNDTWSIVDRLDDCNVVESRFVLRNKQNKDGSLERRKARIVARGFSQTLGVDFNQIFAPVARLSSIRVVIALAARHDIVIRQLNVTTAYLNGELKERIFMEVLKYTEQVLVNLIASKNNEDVAVRAKKMLKKIQSGNKVCLLKKALYGLRQAGRCWHLRLRNELERSGLKQSTADPCVFFAGKEEDSIIVVVYVDDILIVSKNRLKIALLTKRLSSCFRIKDLGDVKYCLRIEFTRDEERISMCQKGYIEEILVKFGMSESKPVSTPMDCSVKLKKGDADPDKCLLFRELVGMLSYLAVCTRPDIVFAVSRLSQFNMCYDESHWTAAKRVLRYLRETVGIGLLFSKRGSSLTGHTYADWANCLDDRRSYTEYVFTFNGGSVSWESKKQRTTALSSTEVEYMALSDAVKEAIYLRTFISELGLM